MWWQQPLHWKAIRAICIALNVEIMKCDSRRYINTKLGQAPIVLHWYVFDSNRNQMDPNSEWIANDDILPVANEKTLFEVTLHEIVWWNWWVASRMVNGKLKSVASNGYLQWKNNVSSNKFVIDFQLGKPIDIAVDQKTQRPTHTLLCCHSFSFTCPRSRWIDSKDAHRTWLNFLSAFVSLSLF